MNDVINIRQESKEDEKTIEAVTIAAFKNNPHSNQTEHRIVSGLRKQNALFVSLIAELQHKVIAHIAFSEIMIDGKFVDWYGLGPVSVVPEFQGRGIGSKLIKEGIKTITKLGANGCVLLGDPGFYNRFGFSARNDLVLKGVPPEYFQSLLISGVWVSGNVEYNPVFSKYG